MNYNSIPEELLFQELGEYVLQILTKDDKFDLESMMNHKSNIILEEIKNLFTDPTLLEDDHLMVDGLVMILSKHGVRVEDSQRDFAHYDEKNVSPPKSTPPPHPRTRNRKTFRL